MNFDIKKTFLINFKKNYFYIFLIGAFVLLIFWYVYNNATNPLTPYLYGYINKDGEVSINLQFRKAGDFHEGIAYACQNRLFDNKCGYIDKTGKFIIKPQFDTTNDFSEEFAKVEINNKSGYIDKTGKFIIKPQFEEAKNLAKLK